MVERKLTVLFYCMLRESAIRTTRYPEPRSNSIESYVALQRTAEKLEKLMLHWQAPVHERHHYVEDERGKQDQPQGLSGCPKEQIPFSAPLVNRRSVFPTAFPARYKSHIQQG